MGRSPGMGTQDRTLDEGKRGVRRAEVRGWAKVGANFLLFAAAVDAVLFNVIGTSRIVRSKSFGRPPREW